jgi:hypothetical protein
MHHRTGRGAAITAAALVLAGCVGALAGCSSSSPGSSGGSAGSTTGPAAGSTTRSTAPAPAAGADRGTGGVTVDLVITGDRPATIKGTKGRCDIPADPGVSSIYEFTGADYPELGAGGDFSVAGPQRPTDPEGLTLEASIKALVGDGGFLDNGGTGIDVSADRTSVTLDADLGGSTGGTVDKPGTPLHDHVTGTIACG